MQQSDQDKYLQTFISTLKSQRNAALDQLADLSARNKVLMDSLEGGPQVLEEEVPVEPEGEN